MGIYLGQLPPAEIARFKAELAETIITNFCYPRFFDQRTQVLRMRPVDRAKRQEVWLYLSSVDFTQWNRIDLLSPDFQLQIERLFIQFVQRNRAFFGEQGRRRMSDVRLLIGTAAAGVVQGLRGHLAGQKQVKHPFGSPRPVLSWTSTLSNGQSELAWEQISAATMTLQQQLQEIRGEVRPAADSRPAANRRSVRSNGETNGVLEPQPVAPAPVAASVQAPVRPAPTPVQGGRRVSAPLPSPNIPNTPAASVATPTAPRRSETPLTSSPVRPAEMPAPPVQPTRAATEPRKSGALPAEPTSTAITSPNIPVTAARNGPPSQDGALTNSSNGSQSLLSEDLAIFEQLRHQLIVWLRVEAVTAGVEIANLSPSQLLDVLRQQGRQDETRLQVVSSLLNLANQVIKAGSVSLLDYKQALMLHLMHSKR